MHQQLSAWCACWVFAFAGGLGGAARSFAGELDGLLALLAGEYNNNEQVWQQGLDDAPLYPRRHWRFERGNEAQLKLFVGLGQAAAGEGWVLAFAEDRLAIRSDILRADGGATACRYRWRMENDGFAGSAQQDATCPEEFPGTWQVTPTHLLGIYSEKDGDQIHRARRVQPYQGWVSLQRKRIDPKAAQDDFIFLKDLRLHDEGFLVSVTDDGQPTGYAVELARLTYQRTQVAVLKLGIIDEATGKTLSYSWTAPLSERIGINLRWIQAGLTRLDE